MLTTGWVLSWRGRDPATGFGSVDYAAFKAQMVQDLDAAAVRAAEARLVARARAARSSQAAVQEQP